MTEVTNDPTSVGTNAWTNPTYAYLDDANKATAVMAAKNTSIAGIWGTFGFTDPGGTTVITKVEIGTQHYLSTASSIIATMGREISWDGGSTWGSHAMDEVTTEVTSETATLWVECTADTAWTWTKLNDTNLKTRITCYQGNDATSFTMYLDVIYVRVTYNTVAACEVYAAEAILSYEVPPCEVYAAEAILNYTAPAEVYAAEAILNYEVPPAEVYAAEAILNYTVAAEVYAAEAILDYEVASADPCEVYAAEAVLDYTVPAEVYAAEAILDYEVPPCEVYTAEAILDYIVPAEVYAAEAVLDYEVPPCEVYTAEVVLDYTAPAEIYAAECALDYVAPAEVYAAECALDYTVLTTTGGGSSPPFRWPIYVGRKTPDELKERRTPKKPIRITAEDSVALTDESHAVILSFAVPERVYLDDNTWMEKQTTAFDGVCAGDTGSACRYASAEDGVRLWEHPSICEVTPERHAIVRERSLEKAETIHELARAPKPSFLRKRLVRAKDPSMTAKLENAYARELDALFAEFKRSAARLLGRRELSDDWDEVDAPDLLDKFDRMIEVTITVPGKGVVRRFTTRAYANGGMRSSQFLNTLGIRAVFSILPADRYALDVLVTRDLSGLKGITDEMSKQIMSEITDGMLRGDSMDKVAKAIDDRIDSIGRSRAEVLARTETMKAFNEGSLTQYDKHGITEVEWLAAPGDRTCDECMSLDGQRFPIDSKPDCPLHPNCRCIILPVIAEVA